MGRILVRPQNAPPERCRFSAFSWGSSAIFSPCERCASFPSSGFEIFVPGRQENPACRSANLLERTVSHVLCRLHLWFFHVLRPNQSMKPTAPPRNKFSEFATTPCRGLSLSR